MPDQYLHLRQIATPTGNPQAGGNLLYFKSDGNLYKKSSAGVETAIAGAGTGDVTMVGVQTLTNKTILGAKYDIINDTDGDPALGIIANAGTAVNYLEIRNTASGSTSPTIAAVGSDPALNINLLPKSFGQVFVNSVPVLTTANTQTVTNKDLSSGTNTFPTSLVTLTGTQTLTNKTLTGPVIDTIYGSNGLAIASFGSQASAVNFIQIFNNVTGGHIRFVAAGTDPNVSINLVPKGTGGVLNNGVALVDISSAQVLTNKDLTSGTNTFPTSLVTLTGTQTLTNKTLTIPILTQSATPAAPSAGFDKLYTKSDDELYVFDPNSAERKIQASRTVKVSSTDALTLSGTQTIDGVACVAGDRVLVRHNGVFAGNAFDNGVWVVAAGAWSRATDANTTAKITGASFTVTSGSKFIGYTFQCRFPSTGVMGTDGLPFVCIGGVDFGNAFQAPYANAFSTGASFTDTVTKNFQVWSGATWNLIGGQGAWTAYTPAWTGTTTNPVIGNGTITGAFMQNGKTVDFRAKVICGSTTTFGSGNYRLSLPVAPNAAWLGPLLTRYKIGTNNYHGIVYTVTGSAADLAVDNGTAGGLLSAVTPTVPGTFANLSEIHMSGSYEAA